MNRVNVNSMNQGGKSFLSNFQRNTMQKYAELSPVSKTFVLILVIFVVIFLSYTGYVFYQNFSEFENKQPYLIKDTLLGSQQTMIKANAVPEPSNGKYGVEWTYSFWMFIDNQNYKVGSNGYSHIFHKGQFGYNQPTAASDAATIKPRIFCPMVELDNTSNKLRISLNTYPFDTLNGTQSYQEVKVIDNIPVNKWFHFTLVCAEKSVDIYINGFLKEHWVLSNIPRWNYGNVFICQAGGFIGLLSRFRYFNYAIAPHQIDQLMEVGPSKKPCVNSNELPPYLSKDYWFQTSNPGIQ